MIFSSVFSGASEAFSTPLRRDARGRVTVCTWLSMETYLGSGERLPASILLISQVMKAAAILGALWLVGLLPKRLGWAAVGLRPVSPHWLALGAVAGAAFVVTGLLLVKGLVAVIPQWAGFTRPPFAFDAANSGPVIAAFMISVCRTFQISRSRP